MGETSPELIGMDNLEDTPPWSSFQLVCAIAFVNGSLTRGNQVREEGSNDVRDGFIENLDAASFST